MSEEHLIREFIAEAEEHLLALEPNLLKLEKDPENLELVHDIFLATHNIKGTASYVGLAHISNFTHALETLLDRLRKRDLRTSPELIDALLEGLDMLKLLMNHVMMGKPAPDTSFVEQKLTQWNDQERTVIKRPRSQAENAQPFAAQAQRSASLQPLPFDPRSLNVDLEDCVIFADIAGQQIEFMRLSLDMLRTSVRAHRAADSDQTRAAAESFLKAFHTIQSSANVLQIEILDTILQEHAQWFSKLSDPAYPFADHDIRVMEERINTLAEMTTALSECSQAGLQAQQQHAPSPPTPAESAMVEPAPGQHTLRVNADRVDQLLNLIGELVINRARLMEVGHAIKNIHDDLKTGAGTILDTSPGQRKKNLRLFKKLKEMFDESVLDLGRLTNQLQEGTMQIRMIPLSQIVTRFPRMVRDLSRQAGKEVEINIYGAETELDKTVADVISDPLIHILRNAIDHGIELPEVRKAAGKPAQGKITLSAYHQGNQVVIEVTDDGQGLDLERVKKKALQQQLITPQEAETLQEHALAAYIFHPGFSTLETVSQLSGRGVGLHIVKRYLEQLNGAIELATRPGQGSKFTIRLPLTLAIIPALMVGVKTEIFAIPLASVEEAIRITPAEIKTIESHKVIWLREQPIPLLELEELIGTAVLRTPVFTSADLLSANAADHQLENGTPEQFYGVIIGDGIREIGLLVDSLIGESDIVIKSLDDDLVHVEGISGASIQGDGKISLVLDAISLIDLAIKRLRHKKKCLK